MISIVIPTLNEEKIIEKTLKSLREMVGDFEIIVSDGKSTDKTVEIAKKYADKVIVDDGDKRQTIAKGRNMGAKEARGEYLLFLDADMFIPNEVAFFQKINGAFKKNNKLVAVTVFLRVFPEMETFADRIFYSMLNWIIYFDNNIIKTGASSGEFQFIKKEAFDKVNGFNESFVAGEDFDMFARLSKIGKTLCIPSLFALHTGRRPHKIGWAKTLYSWFMNSLHTTFLNKSWSDVWEEIR